MDVITTALPDVLLLKPRVFGDPRGFFLESFNQRVFREHTGLAVEFVQDNHSRSTRGVLRGLHFQLRQPQGKLVRATAGRVLDVAVDLRPASASFGNHVTMELSADNFVQAWIPPGFAHGFLVLSESAEVQYKTTDYYAPEHERTLCWNDPLLGIAWGTDTPLLSAKDGAGLSLTELRALLAVG